MNKNELLNLLERSPVIAAVRDDGWEKAINSSAEVIFYLKANLLTVKSRIAEAAERGKIVFVHIDLADGIGKDKTGIEFLHTCGVHGVISTRNQLISIAKEKKLLTVQRFFALDSQGLESIRDVAGAADLLEIMPGVVPKIIERFANGGSSVIAGGLIETKEEVFTALNAGASAVSTGKVDLWDI
ncbi:MAG: glycerol-3-phosphate responsive antiterminator [Clostridia bacterium]|nr:glycerol-3-phosphate responsive antiterminator [Clostridia bacterium]